MSSTASLSDLLGRAEALLEARARARATCMSEEAVSAELGSLFSHLEERAAARPDEARRLAGRLEEARARHALQERELPAGVLEDLYDQVRAGVTGESAWRRAGMSEAFLDAPRNLVMWRRAAVAACLLLAVGAGWTLRGEEPDTAGVRADMLRLVDPRDGLLERLDRPVAVPAVARTRPVGIGGRLNTIGTGSSARASVRPSRGVIVFNGAGRTDADARRMLDGVRIFPVPGRADAEAEQN